jgi:hypothetical protein
MFSFGLSLICSVALWRLLRLAFPDKWNVASLLNALFAHQVLGEGHSKICTCDLNFNFFFYRILYTIVCGMFNCLAASLVGFCGPQTKVTWTSCAWHSVTVYHLMGAFSLQLRPVWKTVYTYCKYTSVFGVDPFQTLWNLLCTQTTDLDSSNHTMHLFFFFFVLGVPFLQLWV